MLIREVTTVLRESLEPSELTELQKFITNIFNRKLGVPVDADSPHFLSRFERDLEKGKSRNLDFTSLINMFTTIATDPEVAKAFENAEVDGKKSKINQNFIIRFVINGGEYDNVSCDLVVHYDPRIDRFYFGTVLIGDEYAAASKPENGWKIYNTEHPISVRTDEKAFNTSKQALNSFWTHTPTARVIFDQVSQIAIRIYNTYKDNYKNLRRVKSQIENNVELLSKVVQSMYDNKLITVESYEYIKKEIETLYLKIDSGDRYDSIKRSIDFILGRIKQDMARGFIRVQQAMFKIANAYGSTKLMAYVDSINDLTGSELDQFKELVRNDTQTLLNNQGFLTPEVNNVVQKVLANPREYLQDLPNKNLIIKQIKLIKEHRSNLENFENTFKALVQSTTQTSQPHKDQNAIDQMVVARTNIVTPIRSYVKNISEKLNINPTHLLQSFKRYITYGDTGYLNTNLMALGNKLFFGEHTGESKKFQQLYDNFVKQIKALEQQENAVAESQQGLSNKRVKETTNPKYLGATEKVANISPVLGAKPKKQKALMNKFFGSS